MGLEDQAIRRLRPFRRERSAIRANRYNGMVRSSPNGARVQAAGRQADGLARDLGSEGVSASPIASSH